LAEQLTPAPLGPYQPIYLLHAYIQAGLTRGILIWPVLILNNNLGRYRLPGLSGLSGLLGIVNNAKGGLEVDDVDDTGDVDACA
jgi:hypothetical protein